MFAITSIATLILVNSNSKWYIYHPSKIGQQKKCCRKSIKWSVTASFLFVLNYFCFFMISSKMFLKTQSDYSPAPHGFGCAGFFYPILRFLKKFHADFCANYELCSQKHRNFSIFWNFFNYFQFFSENRELFLKSGCLMLCKDIYKNRKIG